VLALTLLFGKAFCSWLCPVTYIRNFFRSEKWKSHKAMGESTEVNGEATPVMLEHDPEGVAKGAKAVAIASERTAQPAEAAGAKAVAIARDGAVRSANAANVQAGKALPPVGGARDGLHVDSRHLILGGALLSSLVFGFPVFCLVCPVGLTFATIIGVWNLFRFNEASWGLLVFPLIILLEIVFFRSWCTRFCPIAALLSLVSAGNRTFRPKVDGTACLRGKGVDCRVCISKCPEEVDPHSPRIPECSKCGLCADHCPAHAITFPLRTSPDGAQPASEVVGADDVVK